MDLNRFLGPMRITWVSALDLGARVKDRSWHIIRRDSDGARFVLERWHPRPSDKELDKLKDIFLSSLLNVESSDFLRSHFGYSEDEIWYLQLLTAPSLGKLWPEWSQAQRNQALNEIERSLRRLKAPRLLHPETICFQAGRILIPRTLGETPWGIESLTPFLAALEPPPAAPSTKALPWHQALNLSEPVARTFRGRHQELTYIKSLLLGLSAPGHRERILLIQGEEGLGKERMADWACAVAESDGIWVHHLTLQPDEAPGSFLSRLIQEVLDGYEADLYAAHPDVARSLARKVSAFNFLLGPRGKPGTSAGVEPEEQVAAMEALDFSNMLHARLIYIAGMERASQDLISLVRDLMAQSHLPWLITLTSGGSANYIRTFVAGLRSESFTAIINLNRLEDDTLRAVLGDILGYHQLPADYQAALFHRSMGNPGLLRSFLELAQQDGSLQWESNRWTVPPGAKPALRGHEELIRQVFLGRMHRLGPAETAFVRLLALVDQPVELGTIAEAIGLKGESLEETVTEVTHSKLVLLQGNLASIPDPKWRNLLLDECPVPELKRLAKALLRVVQDKMSSRFFSVTLLSLAFDSATALAQVFQYLEEPVAKDPHQVQAIVEQALALKPSPTETARLYESLADTWGHSSGAAGSGALAGSLNHLEQALASLNQALNQGGLEALLLARLYRKKALILLQVRRYFEAQEALAMAGEAMVNQSDNVEHSRLRLALGRLYLLQGFLNKGLRALEEAMTLLGALPGKPPAQDQAAILLELGRALSHMGQFQRSGTLLQNALRLLEAEGQTRMMVPAQIALAEVRFAQGFLLEAFDLLRDALQTSRAIGDLPMQARSHYCLGCFRSLLHQFLPAQSHLERALERFHQLGDVPMALMATVWLGRTYAAMGDSVQAEHLLLQSLSGSKQGLTPSEEGEVAYLQGEIYAFQEAWKDAGRHFLKAAQISENTGLVWRQRMSVVKRLQAEIREVIRNPHQAEESLVNAWGLLETQKALAEGTGSKWLELEWSQCHAMLLNTTEPTENVVLEHLQSWSQVLSLSRDLQYHPGVVEASCEGAELLFQRGERLGARSKLQDAIPSFQALWNHLPENQVNHFFGRTDIHRFRSFFDRMGLIFELPDREESTQQDWAQTRNTVPAEGS